MLNQELIKNRSAFSNYNMVRMREAIRYFTKPKLELFIKIPFLIHINSPHHPGFIDAKPSPHGIWNFQASGFYKEALKMNIFPNSIVEYANVENPGVIGFYHIGSLGTFTQSLGSDFDYWIIIDKKNYNQLKYSLLENKLNEILKYARESYHQKVSFFIMDQYEIQQDNYKTFEGEETIIAPKFFLKEEFYRTYLFIAGKIPIWSVLPDSLQLTDFARMNSDSIAKEFFSLHDDLIDLGQIGPIPREEVLKGILWHICKSKQDPVKALIKATMNFIYGFSQHFNKTLLCDKVKAGYENAGIDDYDSDSYKLLFDQILTYHEKEDPKGLNLIKNAIFLRLCGYPNVKMPAQNMPKQILLKKYIRLWNLNKSQVGKLLSYETWSESEKLLLEKTIIQRLAQMYNHANKRINQLDAFIKDSNETRNWAILRHKTMERLKDDSSKIPACSIFLKQVKMDNLEVIKTKNHWILKAKMNNKKESEPVYEHKNFFGILGWVMENQLYYRQTTTLELGSSKKVYESANKSTPLDQIYLIFQPLKLLSDHGFEKNVVTLKIAVLLVYEDHDQSQNMKSVECLISNSWGELLLKTLYFSNGETKREKIQAVARLISYYSSSDIRIFFFQLTDKYDSSIVSEIKKSYTLLVKGANIQEKKQLKPYLDKL